MRMCLILGMVGRRRRLRDNKSQSAGEDEHGMFGCWRETVKIEDENREYEKRR